MTMMLAPRVEDIEQLDFPPTCDPPNGTCDAAATWVIELHCQCPTVHLLCEQHVPAAREVIERLAPAQCRICKSGITEWDITPLQG